MVTSGVIMASYHGRKRSFGNGDDVSRASSQCHGRDTENKLSHLDDQLASSLGEPASVPLVEFAVNVSDQDDLLELDEALKRRGFKMVASDLEGKTIQVQMLARQDGQQKQQQNFQAASDSKRPALDVMSLQKYLEQETGFLAVLKGMGQLASAVAELRPSPAVVSGEQRRPLFGVIRLSQMEDGACFVDGLIDHNGPPTSPPAPVDSESGLSGANERPGQRHSLAVHEFGDLSADNYASIGRPTVELFEEDAGETRLPISIQRVVPRCEVAKQIGKSIALSLIPSDQALGERLGEILSAGVIARASTIEANKKQVCTCSGKTLWQERAERSDIKPRNLD